MALSRLPFFSQSWPEPICSAKGSTSAGADSPPVLQIEHADAFYGKAQVLFGVSITVRRGQQVSYWHGIGQVGSSGRSTGTHLHYEVLVGGKSLDPERFMRAGKDVFKR